MGALSGHLLSTLIYGYLI